MNLETETKCGYTVPQEMKEVWQVQLDMAKALFDVCERHGLKIWMECGTLLGAVRHQGFIPWDDDIDFVMLRKDYDKLMALGSAEFQHPYLLQTTYSDTRLCSSIAKLRHAGTTAICRGETGRKYCQGIDIDIFVLDGFIENPVLRFLHRTTAMVLKKAVRGAVADFHDPMSFGKKVIAVLSKGLHRFVDYRKTFALYERVLRMADADKCERVGVLSYRYSSHRHIRRRDGYDTQVWIPFEDTLFPAPADTHDALVCYFGEDYMTPMHLPTDHGQRYLDAHRPYTEVTDELMAHPERFAERVRLLYTE